MSEAGKRLSNLLGRARPKGERWHGIVGNFDGVVDVPNKPGWKYVRIPKAGTGDYELGEFPELNVSGTVYNAPVLIEYDPLTGQRIIAGGDQQASAVAVGVGPGLPDPGAYSLPKHSPTQQVGGSDQMTVSPLQISNIQVSPSATAKHVTIGSGLCVSAGVLGVKTTDTDVDLTAYFPASGYKLVWVTLTNSGAAQVIDPLCTSFASLTLPTTTNYVAALVKLQAFQPITWGSIVDVRREWGGLVAWDVAGQGARHASDIAAAALLRHNAAPSAAGNYMRDSGAAWVSTAAFDATVPTTIAESAVSAAGSATTFAHRDHVHGAPATWTPSAHNHDGVYSPVGHDHSGVYEPVLGNPAADGYVLSSTAAGVRSWVAGGGAAPALTSTYIGYGDGSNLLTGSSIFVFDNHGTWGYLDAPTVSPTFHDLVLVSTSVSQLNLRNGAAGTGRSSVQTSSVGVTTFSTFNSSPTLGSFVFNAPTTFEVSVAAKPSGSAGIALSPNAATGDFTLSLSPANLTASHRATFPNYDIVVAGSASALTSGRLPYISTGGLLADSANATLDASGNAYFAGKVGIGLAPVAKLQVHSGAIGSAYQLGIRLSGTYSAASSGQAIDWFATGYVRLASIIGGLNAAGDAGELIFSTNPSVGSDSITERMRIASNGAVTIVGAFGCNGAAAQVKAHYHTGGTDAEKIQHILDALVADGIMYATA